MSVSNDRYEFCIRRRPWWYWSIGIVWLVAVYLAVETAVASRAELEPRAATISLMIAGVLLAAGVAGYVIERRRAAPRS